MENELYTIIEFDENDKWFVISETIYNNEKYNYLIRVTQDENDFIEDFMVVKCFKDGDDEYFDTVKDKNILSEVVPLLLPQAKDVLNSPEALEKLREN